MESSAHLYLGGVTAIVLVTGFRRRIPGFALVVVGDSDVVFTHLGRITNHKQVAALKVRIREWKVALEGPTIQTVELDRGTGRSFFRDMLRLPEDMGRSDIDLRSYYAGVMGEDLRSEHCLDTGSDLVKKAQRQAMTYRNLVNIRSHFGDIPESAKHIAQILAMANN